MSAKKARPPNSTQPTPADIEPSVDSAVETGAKPAVETAVEIESRQPLEPAQADVIDPGPPPTPSRVFRISRRKSGDRQPHFEDFEIEVEPGDTVLDALLRIRRTREPSLVVRHSCMHASCGTCGVRINGRESLACDTKVDALRVKPAKPATPGKPTDPIKVEPLVNQRPVADLATDMVDFYARFEAAGLPLVRDADGPAAEPPDGIKAFVRFENCIECGLCLSACPIARKNHDYIGPAALAAAARVVEEPRGSELGPVLALAAEPDSVWRCHDALECNVVCPSAVEPALAVLTLRRHVAANGARRFLGRFN
jgi:succinate dehydrogenase / fumarate reductase iron-sulfur subunit